MDTRSAEMYLSYYKLEKPPFGSDADRSFLWWGKRLGQIYSAAKTALGTNDANLLITGQAGVGKSTLLNYLKDNFDTTHLVTHVQELRGDTLKTFGQIASEIGIRKPFSNKSEFLVLLRNKLQHLYSEQKKWLLIVDDADLVKDSIVKELFMLSLIRMHEQPMVQIVFAGIPVISDSLLKLDNPIDAHYQLLHYELLPFSKEETSQYIAHRLQVAGRTKKLFKEDAIRKIFINSAGIPLSINFICDQALKEGFKSKKKLIKADIVNRCGFRAAKRSRKLKDQPGMRKAADNLDASNKPARKTGSHSALYTTLAIVSVVLFFGFAAYYYYEFLQSETGIWKIEEIAPKENPLINERLREKEIEEGKLDSASPTNGVPSTEENAQAIPEAKEKVASKASAELPSDKSADSATDWQTVEKLLVYFRHDSNELSDEAYKSLNDLAEFLKTSPGLSIVVRGHTDSTGTYNYNIAISKIRAEVVESYLIARGVAPNRIESVGLGPQNPIRSNATEEGRRLNRRVEIEIVPR